MDIYSAARRLGRPRLVTDPISSAEFPIGERAIIGDGCTTALVRIDGAIDWLCMPRFDSPSVFAQILDRSQGGITAVTPAHRPFNSLQRYDPDTNVLETLFEVPGEGVARITDYMPWADDPRASIHEIHRRVDCLEGEVALEAIFDPRFDYGASLPRFEINEHGVVASDGGASRLAAVLAVDEPWTPRPEGGLRARFALKQGQRTWLILSWGAPAAERIAAYRPYDQLRTTRAFWRAWAQKLHYDGPWRHHVLRSALLLKLLIYAPTGAMVAAPTTSLPEWIGGRRNWDYRYAWVRDAALGVRAANLIGFPELAREFFHFVRDVLDGDEDLELMVAVDGGRVPDERILSALGGHQGSPPVRIGNGARDQLQLDNAGYLLDAALVYERSGGSLTLRAWRHLVRIVERLRTQWQQPDHGIWEPRSGMRHNVHSKMMCWVAFHRALKIARLFGGTPLEHAWMEEVERIAQDVAAKGMSSDGRSFASVYGTDDLDATLLLLPTYGFVRAHDPRVRETIDRVRRGLGDNGFLYRYLVDDGVGGREGAFVLCGFWLAEALAMSGDVDGAQEVFVRHAESSNHVGLLSEEIDPATGALLGNFPQAFSHMGLINAAARIDLALHLRDERSARPPRFAIDV